MKADAALPPFERYQRHREQIRRTLVKQLVTQAGYERQHIVREFLQNAESAYASKRVAVHGACFEFPVTAGGSVAWRNVAARHAGRGFNEPDRENRERH